MIAKVQIEKLILAAAYVRMSTSRQEDSPERQRRQINEYALKHGYKIVRWYEDHGQTGTESAKRANYQQLIADSTIGAFSAVLIAEMSRMSREDLFTVIPQWGAFKDAGISLVSCSRGPIDFSSMGGFLCAIIDQYSAHDESRKLADRVVSGSLTRVLNGERISGVRLFGFDRNIVDRSGRVLTRVSFRDQFHRSPDCQSVLVPSADASAVEAVQWAFQHILDGGSYCSVAKGLNSRGQISMRGAKFTVGTVRMMLVNPSYAGMTRTGFKCTGKFSRMSDTHGPILKENTHAPIIDKTTFEAVQARIESRSVSKDTWRTYLLSGLCVCGSCGRRMNARGTEDHPHRYNCAREFDYARKIKQAECPRRHSIDGTVLERAVIREWCKAFLVDDVADQLKLKPVVEPPKHEQEELKTIGDQIARAETNLALAADAADFATVSAVLKQLRARESVLRDRLAKSNRKQADLSPDITRDIKRLKDAGHILNDWPNVGTAEEYDDLLTELAIVFKKTIASITLKTYVDEFESYVGMERITRRSGVLSFNPDHVSLPDVILTDDMLGHPNNRKYKKVVDELRKLRRPATPTELARIMGYTQMGAVRRFLSICEHEGTVKQTAAGWIPIG